MCVCVCVVVGTWYLKSFVFKIRLIVSKIFYSKSNVDIKMVYFYNITLLVIEKKS